MVCPGESRPRVPSASRGGRLSRNDTSRQATPHKETVTVIREVSLLVLDAERPWEFHMCLERGRSHHHAGVKPAKIEQMEVIDSQRREKLHGCGLK